MKYQITTTTSSGKSTYEVEGDECLDLLNELIGKMQTTSDEWIDGEEPATTAEDISFALIDVVSGAFFDRADQLHAAQTKTA